MLLVLDLDQTLIYSSRVPIDIDNTEVKDPDFIGLGFCFYKRNGLDKFIEFCFQHFDVAVWTAAGEDYAQHIISNIFGSHASNLKFIYTSNKCSHKYDPEIMERYCFKRLKKIWNKKNNEFTRYNTIIIDDNPSVYQENYGNALPVREFIGQNDNELLLLIQYLPNLKNKYHYFNSIRNIDKRSWRLV